MIKEPYEELQEVGEKISTTTEEEEEIVEPEKQFSPPYTQPPNSMLPHIDSKSLTLISNNVSFELNFTTI